MTPCRRLALLLVMGAVAVLAPAASADESLDAGDAAMTVQADPWQLRFSGGGVRLTENTGTGPSGALGFRAGGVWFHATRATALRREGDAILATVATDYPSGRTLDVRIAPDGNGIV